jgi:DNA polymerase-3 subunit delta
LFYIFHGDDTFTVTQTVADLKGRLAAEDPAADLNFSDLEGARLTLGGLEAAASALPFLGDRRLVVVHGLVGRCDPRSGDAARETLADGLKNYLPKMPPSTRLVFVEGRLAKNNPVLRWAQGRGDDAVVKEYAAPRPADLPAWLRQRAQQRGGAIEAPAARALTDALTQDRSIDLRRADTELEKLLTYAGDRPVTAADVEALVTSISLESIFRLVDALAERDGKAASTLLHEFLATGEHPLRLLALISRQVRLLARTRSLMDEGVTSAQLTAQLPVPPFVARKLERQARRFSLEFLSAAIRRVAEIDTDIKSGQMNDVMALDLFVAAMCGTGVHEVG